MRKITIIVASLLMSSAAFAETTTSTQPQNTQPQTTSNPQQASQSTPQDTAKIVQQIKTNLQQAGFKDIRLVPSSFMVRAEDKNNNPVMMVINPDSITEVTESGNGTPGHGQNTVGQHSSSSSSTDNSANSTSH